MKLSVLALLLIALGVAWAVRTPPTTFPTLQDGPEQSFCLRPAVRVKGYDVFPLASYRLTARVVAARRYQEPSYGSVSPVDLGLAWGRSAEPKRLAGARFTQENRHLWYTWKNASSQIDTSEVANTHIIPADAAIESRVLSLKPGDLVRLSGYLVRVETAWTSSLTRADSGDGACELMYVTSAEVVGPVPSPPVVKGSPTPRTKPAVATPPPPALTFASFTTVLSEANSDRQVEVVVVAKHGAKIAFCRKQDGRLFVVPITRLKLPDQLRLAPLADGSETLLSGIEQGRYAKPDDVPGLSF